MAGAIEGAARSRKEPANQNDLTLRQAAQAKSGFAAIADNLTHHGPTGAELRRERARPAPPTTFE
jgi:uncharacterized protein YkwD